MENKVKKSTRKDNFYLPIIESLKTSTNLNKIQDKLKISKQKLNYYLREMKKQGIIIQKGRGWYELVKEVKDLTKYGEFQDKDTIRGHAYVWEIKLPKEIEGWKDRIDILTKKGIHFKLVGAKLDVPRIKVLGRKVWLCKEHIRVFDKKDNSYYGKDAKESRTKSFNEILLIVDALEHKLGILFNIQDIYFKKEHYALIKNDLAIEHNRKGEIIRVSDENGEWLLIDDSLEQGGELENVGKKSFQTNIPMQKWWNDNKQTNFQVTPSFLMEALNKIVSSQAINEIQVQQFAKQIKSHLNLIKSYRAENKKWRKAKEKEILGIKQKEQTKLGRWF